MQAASPAAEWSVERIWNPFNSFKVLAHVPRWELIIRGAPIPQPALVTIDPINRCNLNCPWCNSAAILKERTTALSRTALLRIARFLPTWQGSPHWPAGVPAICIAGGGEPLLNMDIDAFILECVKHGIQVGVVTNGTMLRDHLNALSYCTWVGVSIDAGTSTTYNVLKGLPAGSRHFEDVLAGIKSLVSFSREQSRPLASTRSLGHGVTYKFLLSRGNVDDVAMAAAQAKESGCRAIHIRPVGAAWFDLGSQWGAGLDEDALARLTAQVDGARELEAPDFGVYCVRHKMSNELRCANTFSSCHAVFMTGVFMPPHQSDDPDALTFGLCCDRRGDKALELASNISSPDEIAPLWGGDAHWAIHDRIQPSACPRCTYQPHNQVFEWVIERDSMTYRFM